MPLRFRRKMTLGQRTQLPLIELIDAKVYRGGPRRTFVVSGRRV